MKKILLTGSTSFLGTKFAQLYGATFKISGLARNDNLNPVDLLDFTAVKKIYASVNPDFVIHLAADVNRDATTGHKITETNPAITRHLLELASHNNTPFVFTSSESVYGGKEQTGGYVETDPYMPRSTYGESKVASEKLIISSGVPYLITRGHRYVGINRHFSRPKQFPDALRTLVAKKELHADAHKLFRPVLINNLCQIITHYILSNAQASVIINVGVDRAITFYDLMKDIACALEIDPSLVKSDGDEEGWPANSTLCVKKAAALGYPAVSYQKFLEKIRAE